MAEMVKSFSSEGASSRTGPNAENQPGDAPGREVVSEAKEVASRVADQAKGLVSTQMTQRAGRSAEDLNDVARALRQTKQQLSGNFAEPYVDKAADQLERFSRFLREADAQQMVRGVERFARREPLLFLGGAFALGMLGARFLKSSARHTERREWGDYESHDYGSRDYGSRGYEPRGEGSRDYRSAGIGGTSGPRDFSSPEAGGTGGARERGSTGRSGSTLHGVGPAAPTPTTRAREIPINAPDPRGDYPANEPGQGPFPGGGAGRTS